LTNIGNGGSSYTPIILEDLNEFTSIYPSSFSNDSFFNYFRGGNPGNAPLGVLVTINNYEYNQPLFQILKTINHIRIGRDFYDDITKELKFETTTEFYGNVIICNFIQD
jgi:hypothetical protein